MILESSFEQTAKYFLISDSFPPEKKTSIEKQH